MRLLDRAGWHVLTLDPPGFSVEAQSLFPEPYEA
jgi:hypothetical protein